MKVSTDPYCDNVTDLAKAVHFDETVLGLEITHRIETLLSERCMEAEPISELEPLERWTVTAAFGRDPDGDRVEILEHHGEAPALSGPGRDR